MYSVDEILEVCKTCISCFVWLQNVADLGSSFQSAQQKQLAVLERLDAIAVDCSSVNSSVLRFDDVITSLSARLTDMQAVVNETRVSYCCTGRGLLHDANLNLYKLSVMIRVSSIPRHADFYTTLWNLLLVAEKRGITSFLLHLYLIQGF